MADAEQTPLNKAIVESKQLKEKPQDTDLLQLYSLFKVARNEDIKSARSVGMFEFAEKEKRKAWQAKVDEGLTPDQAAEQYVALVESLKAKHGHDPSKTVDN